MAILYVRSTDGNDSDNGSTWALAKATLAGAFSAASAGDTIYVSQAHAETQASNMTLTSPGTIAAPCYVVCANDGAAPPTAVATTATISTTTAGDIAFDGSFYCYGITFSCGAGGFTASFFYIGKSDANYQQTFDNCTLFLADGGNSAAIFIGHVIRSTSTSVKLFKSYLKFGATGQGIVSYQHGIRWIGGGIAAGSAAITGASASNGAIFSVGLGNSILLDGVDLSAADAAANIFYVGGMNAGNSALAQNCKLPASWSGTLTAGSFLTNGPSATMIDGDNAGTNYQHQKVMYAGSQIVETTIVRTGGATDGTTPISWKIVTSANALWVNPYSSIPAAIWNDSTSSVTATVYGYIDQASLPKNDDVWVEFHYLGSSGSPVATIDASNTKATILTTNADQGSDSSTWGGGDTTTRFKMSATFTPAMNGPIYAVVKVAKASATFYIDPKIVLT